MSTAASFRDLRRRIAQARLLLLALIVAAGLPGAPVLAQDPGRLTVLTGRVADYGVRPGDTLSSISARLGASTTMLVEINQLDRRIPLAPGRLIQVDNRHIATIDAGAQIAINIAQRMLYDVDDGFVTAFPIAVGLRNWPTPVGAFTVTDKEENPTWDVPPSIQEEMRQQGRPVVTKVPPSPQNPLGAHWIRLSFPSLGIHGTIAPGSVYSYASHGCIRMHPDDVARLFERVGVGTAGVITYQPVLIALIEDRVFLEAHPDVYRRAPDPMTYLRAVAERGGFMKSVDWAVVPAVLREKRGVAVDVTKVE